MKRHICVTFGQNGAKKSRKMSFHFQWVEFVVKTRIIRVVADLAEITERFGPLRRKEREE